ncbi:MAG: T9SS type A sorting domain-containing protein, partial [Bacteroidia bacterium]|nr:T9SS type A sorting domain-containing protein [Bacteroidia bacterium]
STKEIISNANTFEIMNVNGQKISNVKYLKQDNVIEFDVSDMPEGIYILKITTIDGKKSSIKFQKR